jgi:outer membrane biosynthesis protein TonB
MSLPAIRRCCALLSLSACLACVRKKPAAAPDEGPPSSRATATGTVAPPSQPPRCYSWEAEQPPTCAPQPPSASFAIDTTDTSETPTPQREDAARAVSNMRPALTTCYNQALKRAPRSHGTARVQVWIDCQGTASKVQVCVMDGLDQELSLCVVRTMKALRMPPPASASTIINVPVTFVHR